MPIHDPFGGVLGAHFPQMMSLIVLTPKKDRPWAELRHLSHKPGISVARFELGVGARKKGQDRKKVTKGYFTYLWRSPHRGDVLENLFST